MKPSSPLLLALALGLVACQQAGQEAPADAGTPAPATSEATQPAPSAPAAASRAEAGDPPSFDCAIASGDVEKLICSDPQLAALDRHLAEVEARVRAAPGADQARLAAGQRDWIKDRDACVKSIERSRCVSEAYMTRTARLQIDNGEATALEAVAYDCDDNSKRFNVVYYNDLDPRSAIVTWGDEEVIAFPMMAASGARYGREGMEIWEHQGVLSVDFNGTRFTCRVPDAPAP